MNYSIRLSLTKLKNEHAFTRDNKALETNVILFWYLFLQTVDYFRINRRIIHSDASIKYRWFYESSAIINKQYDRYNHVQYNRYL